MSRRKMERLARDLGVEIDNRPGDIDATAPKGLVFEATGCHSIVASAWDDDKQSDLYRRMAADLAEGVRPCTYPGCEVCEAGE